MVQPQGSLLVKVILLPGCTTVTAGKNCILVCAMVAALGSGFLGDDTLLVLIITTASGVALPSLSVTFTVKLAAWQKVIVAGMNTAKNTIFCIAFLLNLARLNNSFGFMV